MKGRCRLDSYSTTNECCPRPPRSTFLIPSLPAAPPPGGAYGYGAQPPPTSGYPGVNPPTYQANPYPTQPAYPSYPPSTSAPTAPTYPTAAHSAYPPTAPTYHGSTPTYPGSAPQPLYQAEEEPQAPSVPTPPPTDDHLAAGPEQGVARIVAAPPLQQAYHARSLATFDHDKYTSYMTRLFAVAASIENDSASSPTPGIGRQHSTVEAQDRAIRAEAEVMHLRQALTDAQSQSHEAAQRATHAAEEMTSLRSRLTALEEELRQATKLHQQLRQQQRQQQQQQPPSTHNAALVAKLERKVAVMKERLAVYEGDAEAEAAAQTPPPSAHVNHTARHPPLIPTGGSDAGSKEGGSGRSGEVGVGGVLTPPPTTYGQWGGSGPGKRASEDVAKAAVDVPVPMAPVAVAPAAPPQVPAPSWGGGGGWEDAPGEDVPTTGWGNII